MAYGQKKGHVRAKRIASLSVSYVFLFIICVFWIFPFVYLILQSLRGESSGVVVYLLPKQWTFNNYVRLFTDSNYHFGTWYLNTLIIAIFTSIIQTIIVLLTAYALSRMRFKGRTALMKFMLIIGMFPGFLSMVCIYYILKAMGTSLQNMVLASGGTYNEGAFGIFGLVLVYCSGSMMGYYICKGFFDTISKSLDEAAMIDGASRNTIFWKIIMPLSKPIVIYTILTSFLGPWGDFMMANFLVARGAQTTWTVAVGMQNWLTPSNMPDYFTVFCAGGVFVSIIPTILFFFMQRFYVEGVTGGAVKG